MYYVYKLINNLLKEKESFAAATIISKSGSGPREAGTKMIVKDDLSIIGTIGGGKIEASVIELCRQVLKDKKPILKKFSLNNKLSSDLGMACGGSTEVYIEYIDLKDNKTFEIFSQVYECLRNFENLILITEMETNNRNIVTKNKGISGLYEEININRRFVMLKKDNKDYMIENFKSEETVFIFGCGHIGFNLSKITKFLNYKTVVLDDRAEFADKNRFEDAVSVVLLSNFSEAFNKIEIDDSSYIVIVTRGHLNDAVVLEEALKTKAKYIGMIGSRKKIAEVFRVLSEKGYGREDFDRVHSPIGIEINSETPEEIAISIGAELIKVRRND